MCELGDADGEAFDALGDIVRGGLAFERGVHREDDFVDAAGFDAADEAVDAEVLGADAFECGQATAENVEATGEQAGAI